MDFKFRRDLIGPLAGIPRHKWLHSLNFTRHISSHLTRHSLTFMFSTSLQLQQSTPGMARQTALSLHSRRPSRHLSKANLRRRARLHITRTTGMLPVNQLHNRSCPTTRRRLPTRTHQCIYLSTGEILPRTASRARLHHLLPNPKFSCQYSIQRVYFQPMMQFHTTRCLIPNQKARYYKGSGFTMLPKFPSLFHQLINSTITTR